VGYVTQSAPVIPLVLFNASIYSHLEQQTRSFGRSRSGSPVNHLQLSLISFHYDLHLNLVFLHLIIVERSERLEGPKTEYGTKKRPYISRFANRNDDRE